MKLTRQLYAKRPRGRAASYAVLYPSLVAEAKRHGYALAIHGSMRRDLDLVAIPWTDAAAPPMRLVGALCEVTGGQVTVKATKKPHGRVAHVIYFGPNGYIDLSVMPRWRVR